MKYDCDSYSNQIFNFLAFLFIDDIWHINTISCLIIYPLNYVIQLSFNCRENRVGYNVAKIYTRSKKMECAQMDMEKLDLHHSFLKCCWPQIHPYYILDNILMADSQWPCLKNSLKRWRRKEAKSIFDQG